MKKAGMVWCTVLVCGMLIAAVGAMGADGDGPCDVACAKVREAIEEKTAMLDAISATLEKEQAAYDALDQLLSATNYAPLKKGDIIQARKKIFSAMQHEIQAADALHKSIQNLNDSLASLGIQPDSIPSAAGTASFSPENLYDLAAAKIAAAILLKERLIERMNSILDMEADAYEALALLMQNPDLTAQQKAAIVKAMHNIHAATRHEQQATDKLDKSVDNLADVLTSLGCQDALPPAAVASWMMDEKEGNIAYDSVGTNDGTVRNGQWVEGVLGSALYFYGAGYVNVPDQDETLDFGAYQDFSISLWFNIARRIGSSAQEIIGKRDRYDIGRGFKVYYDDRSGTANFGKIVFAVDVGPFLTVVSTTDVGDQQWHHLVAVRRGQIIELYIDGMLEDWAQGPEYADDLCNSEPLRMGMDCTGSTKDYYGSLDEAVIFKTALTDLQVWTM